MKHSNKAIPRIFGALVCAVSWCQVGAQNAPSTGGSGEFAQALARNYEALSRAEAEQGDRRDARTYAMRAEAASAGNPPAPDDGAARLPFLNAKYLPELTEARDRLMRGLGSSMVLERAPASAARAQSSYDCWLEQAEEGLQPEDIEACKSSFMTAIGEVESASTAVAQTEEPPPPPPPAPVEAPVERTPNKFLVFFDFDKAEVTTAAREVLQSFQADMESNGVRTVVAVGHTDTSGTDSYNQRLSQRRAEAVRQALMRNNVPAERIETEARGESEPLVATGDGVREPQNRRVELTAH